MTASLEQLRRCHFAVDLGAARTRCTSRAPASSSTSRPSPP
ncbi:hypothetical protein ACFQV4_07310 [Streptomyces thermocarboxydus]